MVSNYILMQRTVWIIDDDMVSQFATRYCLEQFGDNFVITTFSNAETGLAAVDEFLEEKEPMPELIFLDLVMDEIDGWEFIEALKKKLKKTSFPEIYVLSAFANSKDRARAKAHKKVAGFFDKPLTRVSLAKVFTESPAQ